MKESQLDNKTAIATNDYVRMVDENGNSVKIKKDSFMAAIRDALPSIISDGATDGGSVLSIIGGALKSRTDANLASVLGAYYLSVTSGDFNDLIEPGKVYNIHASNLTNRPSNGFGRLEVTSSSFAIYQTFYEDGADYNVFFRKYNRGNQTWYSWKKYTLAAIS